MVFLKLFANTHKISTKSFNLQLHVLILLNKKANRFSGMHLLLWPTHKISSFLWGFVESKSSAFFGKLELERSTTFLKTFKTVSLHLCLSSFSKSSLDRSNIFPNSLGSMSIGIKLTHISIDIFFSVHHWRQKSRCVKIPCC